MKKFVNQINPAALFREERGGKRFMMMLFSVLLMGFSISVFSYSDMGVDPFTCMNMSVSAKIGVGFGVWQAAVNTVILIAIAFLSLRLLNVGTVFNMLGVGFVCEFFTNIYASVLPQENSLPIRIALMLTGVILLSLSASLYFTSSLGVSPYDAVGFVLSEKTGLSYKWCRVITDLVCTLIGFLLGGAVGVGTVITAFCMGPIVAFFNKHVSEKLLNTRIIPRSLLTVRFYDFRGEGGSMISSDGRFAS